MEAIGRYQLRHRLGAGAFATVWLAHDPDLAVPVAIKVLADNWSSDLDIRHRFLAEARLLRRLSDDRVVRVHDLGELDDGRPYFVMDYVDGGTVADVLRAVVASDEARDPARALAIGADAARGLHVLHEHGVVHRDVKPGNLLLTDRGGRDHVVIADLGMAKALAESSGLTVTAGTPAYMAPEQAHGTKGFDERADVYAAAAVTYALLTGRSPYAVDDGLLSIATRDPKLTPSPVAPVAGTPRDLDELLRSALAHDPARRPRTALELADRLDGIRHRLATGAAETAPVGTWAGGALVGLAAATVAVFTLATWLTLRLLG
ncbi:serine/threonine-protein kinase [Terracoccus sp. 273MFTsu3.1]|uniref:serine/threonine-protein kinase n=1 Tax=Terracoccus sp. 273MFTsu3.1 TaxID=1172188 RepID=UPI000362E9E7|nr:serine/threonine-protein kinase [Terracoccus sp. 273MFTsu3.1]